MLADIFHDNPLHYITCHLVDAFIQSDLQLASIRAIYWGISILPMDTSAWAGNQDANLQVGGQLLYPLSHSLHITAL